MWVRLNKNWAGYKRHSIIDINDEKDAQKLVDKKIVVRVLGPDGFAFPESAPEDVVKIKSKDKFKEK
jgi:hypothetical protein